MEFLRRKQKMSKFKRELDRNLTESFDYISEDIRLLLSRIQHTEKGLSKLTSEIATNGVVSSVNKLNAEVFNNKKEVKNNTMSQLADFYARFSGFPGSRVTTEEATLAGKVDAIIAHLGLDVTVKPKEVLEAKVVAKKVPTPKKKAGRR